MQSRILAAAAAFVSLLAVPAAASHVTITSSKDVYLPGEHAYFTVEGPPGSLVWLGFDKDPGPTTLPGIGEFHLGFSSSFLFAALPPLPPSGKLELEWICNNPCANPITGNDIWIQGVVLDPQTLALEPTNYTRLNVEDLYGTCDSQGLTPGYWKNHLDAWAATGLDPWADFDATFGVAGLNHGLTLVDALQPPTELQTFGAHAVAALLNALHPDVDYAISAQQVLDMVRAALESGDADLMEWTKDILADLNEKG